MNSRTSERYDEGFVEEVSDEPEIVIDSIYPETTLRSWETSRIATKIGDNIGGFGRHFIKDLELGIKESLASRGFDKASDSHGKTPDLDEVARNIYQKIHEYAHDKLYGGNKGMFGREEDIAIRAFRNVLEDAYGETVMIKGWEPGMRIRHENGDVFELTGSKCERCHVNPEAYGHGGGIRCFDVDNCGYWYCA